MQIYLFQAFNDPEESSWLELGAFGIAQYKGNLIALKRIYKSHCVFPRSIRKEILNVGEQYKRIVFVF